MRRGARHGAAFGILLMVIAGMVGCAQQVGDIDRTQPDKTRKSQLDGEWYVRHTFVEVPPSASFAVAGLQSLTDRITWEIQEDYLIGRRAHEYRVGSEEGRQTGRIFGPDGELIEVFDGAVVVAYRIQGHFDVQRLYNASTGEQSNVIVENYSDRPWHERDFMRVDWSRNLATDYFFFDGSGASFSPVAYFVSEVEVDNPDRPIFLEDYMEIAGRTAIRPDTTSFWFGTYPTCYLDLGTDCKENIVKTRTSFMKRTSDRDMFVGRDWDQTDRAKFQIIDWFRPSHSDAYGQPNASKKWLPLLFNLYDDMRKPVSERRLRPIVYYLNAGWPRDDEAVMWATRKTFTDWNASMREVVRNAGHTDLDEDLLVLCENNPVLPTDPEACRTRVVHRETPSGEVERIEQDIFEITHRGVVSWGDLRFNQLNMVMEPQNYGSVLAFAQMAWEQESGEVLSASTHMLRTTQESYNHRVADFIQLMSGDLPLEEYLTGQTIRERILAEDAFEQNHQALSPLMAETLGEGVERPKTPATVDPAFATATLRRGLAEKLARIPDLSRVREKTAQKIERQKQLGGTAVWAEHIERLRPELDMLSVRMREELMAETDAWPDGARPPEEAIEAMIPLGQHDHRERREATRFKEDWFASRHMLSGEAVYGIGQLTYYAPLVERFRGKSRAELMAYLRPILYYYTIAHELGHNLGLEHNFAGSNDALNFPAEYWLERAQGGYVPDFLLDDEALLSQLDNNQLLRSSQYTSIMEYLPYDFLRDDEGRMRSGVGTADEAALHYAYADMVQVFDEDAVPETWTWVDDKGESHTTDIDKSLIEFDPQVASKNEEYHYSHLPNLVLKDTHHVQVCMSPLGHLCEEAMPDVAFDDPSADGIYVAGQKLTPENAEDLGEVLFTAAVAMSQGRRWVKADEVDGEIEVPYRTCENALAGRTYHCEMHDFGVDLWERTRNVREAADFYYFISHFARDRDTFYTPTYYAWRAAEWELRPLMAYLKHFINRGLIEDKKHLDLWYADPAGGLDALLASFDVLGHWQDFMAAPTMNDRADRLRYRRDPATGQLSPEPVSEDPGASTPLAEKAVYHLDRSDMLMKPLSRFNESDLDKGVTLLFEPGEARYTRSEYDPALGYDYFYRPVIFGNWIAKLIAVEMAADPYTRFVGTDTGADAAYAINMATIFEKEVWETLSGYFAGLPQKYTHGVTISGEGKAEAHTLQDPADQLLSIFPAPIHEAYVQPDESFTAQLYAGVYATFLFDVSADNPFADAANVQILGEDRDIPADAIEGEDYLIVPDFRNTQDYIVFSHSRTSGLFREAPLASPTWEMARKILDIYAEHGFDDVETWSEALSTARREAGSPGAADAAEDRLRAVRFEVEDNLRKFDMLRAMLVRFGQRHVSP